MNNLEKNIKLAQQLISNNVKTFTFDKIYFFTKENIKSCFKYHCLKDKKCLNILARFDQIFDMYLSDCKHVDAFDINPFTIYYFNLKLVFLKSNISMADFISFFNCSLNELEYLKLFEKVCVNLDNENYNIIKEKAKDVNINFKLSGVDNINDLYSKKYISIKSI